MPLDFNTTKVFRDNLLRRTLQPQNGPLEFDENNYVYNNLSDYSNVRLGSVENDRQNSLANFRRYNLHTPETFFIVEDLNTFIQQRNLGLYPSFKSTNHNLISIFTGQRLETESDLIKLNAKVLQDVDGPILSRIRQNTEAATLGRIRVLDALDGNTATAMNIITGREPLIEPNYKITVSKSLLGKGVDLLKTAAGLEFPFSTIPGNFLSSPIRDDSSRTSLGRGLNNIRTSVTDALGLQRNNILSDNSYRLLLNYSGDGQRKALFNAISYSKYRPDYSGTGGLLNQLTAGIVGANAPKHNNYIANNLDIDLITNDIFGNIVKSNYFLSFAYDNIQTKVFGKIQNISEGGNLSGNLLWVSKNSKNNLGINNESYSIQSGDIISTLSTNFNFRSDSILGQTQQLLDSIPNTTDYLDHVANAIDQTNRFFKVDDKIISKGSAVKYINKYNNLPSGEEYCRVWVKDRPYFTFGDTMKTKVNIRKFDSSVLDTPYNLNIAPVSQGLIDDFTGSTNIVKRDDTNEIYAKKYMFSIENLAWKNSNREGFQVSDLPYCERGPNGGRIMWFPPYDIKLTENNSAEWEENRFLGRPEPIYTYKTSKRSATLSFKILVDHPSIINLLSREFFKDMSDDETNNYINAFFSGCVDLDLYDLVLKYPMINEDDISLINRYLNSGLTTEINQYEVIQESEQSDKKPNDIIKTKITEKPIRIFFPNNFPQKLTINEDIKANTSYTDIYNFMNFNEDKKNTYLNNLDKMFGDFNSVDPVLSAKAKTDLEIIFGSGIITKPVNQTTIDSLKAKQEQEINKLYNNLITNYSLLVSNLNNIKENLKSKKITDITFNFESRCSLLADDDYNIKLSVRRSHSVFLTVINFLKNDGFTINENNIKWVSETNNSVNTKITFRDLGYDDIDGSLTVKTTNIGETNSSQSRLFNFRPLNIVAPVAANDRYTDLTITYSFLETQQPSTIIKEKLVNVGTITVDNSALKPPIDVMKRIIMKTLSECYYFKKLEEDSPLQFNSLKEKIKYFHPSFHSMTPEGLNSRLTFLLQCLRPGDTINNKFTDELDYVARNTSFGAPPVCVLRFGDFYNSKIIIDSINFNYDQSTWDMNPEGIGVQPMLVDVNMAFNFIGGHGLENPVNRLQNALSSNFYANTEMYDERSITTNQKIGGINADDFTKKFLQDYLNNVNKLKESLNDTLTDTLTDTLSDSDFFGTKTENSIEYKNLFDNLRTSVNQYISIFKDNVEKVKTEFGEIFTFISFTDVYREINNLRVYNNTASFEDINLIGVSKSKSTDLIFETAFLDINTNSFFYPETNKLSILFGLNFSFEMNYLLNDDLHNLMQTKLNENFTLSVNKFKPLLGEITSKRNEVIGIVDKLNFIIKNAKDAAISNRVIKVVELNDFNPINFYNSYSKDIDFLKNENLKIKNNVGVYDLKNMSQNLIKSFIFAMIKQEEFLTLFQSTKYQTIYKKLEKAIKDNYVNKDYKIKVKENKNTPPKQTSFTFGETEEISNDDVLGQEVLAIINRMRIPANTLNYIK